MQVGIEALLEPARLAFRAPGAAESKRGASIASARPCRNGVAGEDLRLELRLAVAAHGAVGHDAAVVEGGERRVERVERPPARRQRIHRGRVERERDAAVLHADAGAPAARSPSRIPSRSTGCRRPRGRRRRWRPSRPCRRGRRSGGRGRARMSICAASRCEALRASGSSPGSCVSGRNRCRPGRGSRGRASSPRSARGCARNVSALRDAEPVENAEDQQRGETLRRRRRVVELASRLRSQSSGRARRRPRRPRGRRASPGAPMRRGRRRSRGRRRRDRSRRARHGRAAPASRRAPARAGSCRPAGLAVPRKVAAKPGASCSASSSFGRSAPPRARPRSRRARGGSRRRSRSRAAACRRAPATAPARAPSRRPRPGRSAATGPRGGIASWPELAVARDRGGAPGRAAGLDVAHAAAAARGPARSRRRRWRSCAGRRRRWSAAMADHRLDGVAALRQHGPARLRREVMGRGDRRSWEKTGVSVMIGGSRGVGSDAVLRKPCRGCKRSLARAPTLLQPASRAEQNEPVPSGLVRKRAAIGRQQTEPAAEGAAEPLVTDLERGSTAAIRHTPSPTRTRAPFRTAGTRSRHAAFGGATMRRVDAARGDAARLGVLDGWRTSL